MIRVERMKRGLLPYIPKKLNRLNKLATANGFSMAQRLDVSTMAQSFRLWKANKEEDPDIRLFDVDGKEASRPNPSELISALGISNCPSCFDWASGRKA